MSIKVKNVNYTYSEGTAYEMHALKNINLEIPDGQFVGLIGHTGSGKSTLTQHLNGLTKATSGKIYFNGKDIYGENFSMKELRSKVGLVFQYPEHQLFEETVLKDISFGPSNMGLEPAEIEKRARDAAKFVGLREELLEKSPFELSGGEKRRVAIAGVIAMDPDVLILDEPTAGLDPRGRDVLLSQIVNYHEVRHNTILLVSHSMEDIARTADRILVMNGGKAAMFDETKKVFARGEELERMGLRVPQITKILAMLQKDGYPVETALTLEQAIRQLMPLLEEGGRTHG